MDHRKTFNECGYDSVPDVVMNICGMAADNAADTLHGDYRDSEGNHTDAFIDMWVLSVSSILADASCFFNKEESKEARDWFEIRGIDY